MFSHRGAAWLFVTCGKHEDPLSITRGGMTHGQGRGNGTSSPKEPLQRWLCLWRREDNSSKSQQNPTPWADSARSIILPSPPSSRLLRGLWWVPGIKDPRDSIDVWLCWAAGGEAAGRDKPQPCRKKYCRKPPASERRSLRYLCTHINSFMHPTEISVICQWTPPPHSLLCLS